MRPLKNARGATPLFLLIMVLLFGGAVYWQIQWQQHGKDDPFKEIAGHLETLPCPFCHGRGLIPAVGDASEIAAICPYCQGVGGHAVRKFDQYDKLCPACGGMGRIADPVTAEVRECRRCHGRGLIRPQGCPVHYLFR